MTLFLLVFISAMFTILFSSQVDAYSLYQCMATVATALIDPRQVQGI